MLEKTIEALTASLHEYTEELRLSRTEIAALFVAQATAAGVAQTVEETAAVATKKAPAKKAPAKKKATTKAVPTQETLKEAATKYINLEKNGANQNRLMQTFAPICGAYGIEKLTRCEEAQVEEMVAHVVKLTEAHGEGGIDAAEAMCEEIAQGIGGSEQEPASLV